MNPPHTYIEMGKLSKGDFWMLVHILKTRYGEIFKVSLDRQTAQAEASQMLQELEGDMSALMVLLYGLPFAVYQRLKDWFCKGKWEPGMPPQTPKAKKRGDSYFWMASTLYDFAGLKRSFAFIELWKHLPNHIEEVPQLTLLIVYVMLQGEKKRPDVNDIIVLLQKYDIPAI